MKKETIRYAVIGLGHIAQAAVLPAFERTRNSKLTALVSSDTEKLKELSARYSVPNTYHYDQFDECLSNDQVDAVYIALPNDQHAGYTERAGRAGVHVLCEKPMATTTADCSRMISGCAEGGARLMVAYRLHFEEANLRAIELAKSGKLGDVRFFTSEFAMQVKPGNIRVQAARGGGAIWDIGIYCINAARYLLQDEPTDVMAYAASNGDDRFREVEEMVSVTMRFPHGRLASFTCSFGAAAVDRYSLYGTKGSLRVQPCYEYAGALAHHLTLGDKTETREFGERSQFAAEIDYFSDCVMKGVEPEPGGEEGLADVGIIEAIERSAKSGQSVKLQAFHRDVAKPGIAQEIRRAAVEEPELVHSEAPHMD